MILGCKEEGEKRNIWCLGQYEQYLWIVAQEREEEKRRTGEKKHRRSKYLNAQNTIFLLIHPIYSLSTLSINILSNTSTSSIRTPSLTNNLKPKKVLTNKWLI